MKEKFIWIDVVIILLLILGIYFTIWYLIGDTPTEIILFSFVFTVLITLMFRTEDKIFRVEKKLEQKIDRIENKIIEGFKKVGEDINKLR